MLKIRLKRSGRKKRPYFHVVVAEHSQAANKKYVRNLGGYNPLEADGFKVDADQFFDWIKKGAQPSNTVARLVKGMLEKNGQDSKQLDKYIVPMSNRRKKNAPEEESVDQPVPSEEKASDEEKADAQESVEASGDKEENASN